MNNGNQPILDLRISIQFHDMLYTLSLEMVYTSVLVFESTDIASASARHFLMLRHRCY